MERVVSIWLNRWETDRYFRAHRKAEADGADSRIPFALTESGSGGERLCAITSRAAALGLGEGHLLTDARALVPSLQTAPREEEASLADLENLARWCERYTPYAALDRPDGIFLDITGCAHLFGGERQMLQDLQARLRSFFLQARIASANSPGAAWALARYGKDSCAIIPPGDQGKTLANLSVAALRIEPVVVERLHKLGLKRIGQLYDMPRASLAARFGSALLARLDQALALEEPISPLTPLCRYSARVTFPEPISLLEHIELIARDLAARLGPKMEAGGHGAKGFSLKLFGTDGSLRIIGVKSARLLYQAKHIAALFHERIHAMEASYDPGTGVDALLLEAHSIEALQASQLGLQADGGQQGEELSFLLDRLTARLGPNAIRRLDTIESHIPELAQQTVSIDVKTASQRFREEPRPLLLLLVPEAVEVVAQIPDGPPAQFTWRRVRHRVTAADGPERIAQEWWRPQLQMTRDYFRVEDSEHRRYWLYREGLYGSETASPRWFMHGVFA